MNVTISDTFYECINGNHVAHCEHKGRTVALRINRDKTFNVDFSDSKNLKDNRPSTSSNNTRIQAERIIKNFLYGFVVDADCGFQLHINQADRDCEIIKRTDTRLRVGYEMPNAGFMAGWYSYFALDSILYITHC